MPPKYKMRCHYDILGVNRDANESELKRAYRKMALEWHPDKNSHRPEEAETRFKEVRGAYETLSDPNERAWYDSHREAILKAGKHAAGGEDMRPEDEINLMPYFTANAFRGFGDDPGGFYDTYSTLFTALDKQEQAASLAAGKGPLQILAIVRDVGCAVGSGQILLRALGTLRHAEDVRVGGRVQPRGSSEPQGATPDG